VRPRRNGALREHTDGELLRLVALALAKLGDLAIGLLESEEDES